MLMRPANLFEMAQGMSEAVGVTSTRLEQPQSLRYEMLFRVSQAIGAYRDPRELFRALACDLRSVIHFDGIGVVQLDDAGNKVKWHLAEKCGDSDAITSTRVGPEDELFLWVYRSQEAVVLSSVETEERFPLTVQQLKNY